MNPISTFFSVNCLALETNMFSDLFQEEGSSKLSVRQITAKIKISFVLQVVELIIQHQRIEMTKKN
uniref:Uncharacterized protein n=1 Tax=Arundo donax TaxID=35708 RepID=A0A0A9HNX1_ARUDO